ncbi:uncharacterized protein LOC128508749 isoform X1 [Clarias gariepinus]|uniref:uncharacterized protein LOC128508749 isoform X1 n=1 Tax=Clarias gariepinus TaxID=13013 RepID=UPI00234D96B6|nr:uncharacterized protein LOC128508749 isoform X1 [Clarias gariepinus]
METSRVALIALVCVVFSSQKRISGAEVEMRVRRGDDVTLYSDCVWKSGLYSVWFRNCSEKDHPHFMILDTDLRFIETQTGVFPRYSFVFNASTNTHSLLIKNVTETDQGLYYCAIQERVISKDKNGIIITNDVYRYGNRSTRLSLFAPCPSVCEPCESEPSVSWTLVLSVCAVCVLLSSLLSSICVYYLCTHTTKAGIRAGGEERKTPRHDEVGEDEVCYASLEIQNLKKKTTKKKKKKIQTVQDSDFSTYSGVRTERC